MLRRRLPLASLSLLPFLVACGSSGDGSSSSRSSWGPYTDCVNAQTKALSGSLVAAQPPQGPFSASLLATDAARVTDAVRSAMKLNMRRSVEQQRIGYLAATRCDSLRPPASAYSSDDRAESMDSPTAGASNGGSDPSGGGATQVSTTNNQVVGVDEADFIKNDNKYIYVANDHSFRIIEAWPATEAHQIANVPITGEAKKLFVQGDRALVYSSLPKQQGTSSYGNSYYDGYGNGGECTYGQNGCVPTGDGTETEIAIYDITNRAAPALVRTLRSSSSFIAARRIGNVVHTVLGEPQRISANWSSRPDGLTQRDEAAINAAYDSLIASNEAKIDATNIGNILPTWSDSAGASPEPALFQSSMPDGTALTSVISLDLVNESPVKVASVISRSGFVYGSADALYMAVPHRQVSGWGWYEGQTELELSTIHKFAIGASPNDTAYVGTGVVKGRVLNQFAMDEKDGFLRVATTTGHLPDPDAHNTVSIFEDHGGKLDVVGQIDQIAKGEDIRSVRFDGERGFIVTFKKTDPLFVFDLADPRAPKTLGELKIPGFSTYMHMMDATHLLTIGYDAADKGDFAYFTGMILQIFDVTDPQNPTLAHKETIGTRGSSSEAATNHLAFNYFAPKNLLALPMTICEGGDTNGNYGTTMTFSGLMVYDTTTANGFKLRGKVAHPNYSESGEEQNDRGYYNDGCSNWWSNASSEVKRSIIMDDYVFSVSTTRIKVNQLDNLAVDVKELGIE